MSCRSYRGISKKTKEYVYGQYIHITNFVEGKGKSQHWIVNSFKQNGGYISLGTKHAVYLESVSEKTGFISERKEDVYENDLIKCDIVTENKTFWSRVCKVAWDSSKGAFIAIQIDGKRHLLSDCSVIRVIDKDYYNIRGEQNVSENKNT